MVHVSCLQCDEWRTRTVRDPSCPVVRTAEERSAQGDAGSLLGGWQVQSEVRLQGALGFARGQITMKRGKTEEITRVYSGYGVVLG